MNFLLIPILYFYFFTAKLLSLLPQKKSRKGILYLAVFFPQNAGYHWRVKVWADQLRAAGADVTINIVFEKEQFEKIFIKKHALFLIKCLHIRFWQVVRARKFETVIVRRELLLFNDYGNLFLEKLLLKINPNVILDFDDDLAAAKSEPKQITNWYGKLMQENGNKFNDSLRLYKKFIVASSFLKKRVLHENKMIENKDILVVPTCVDYDRYPKKNYDGKSSKLVFGWIGGTHNYRLLDLIIPTLNDLAKEFEFKLVVIGGETYKRDVLFDLEFIPWSLETEVKNLMCIDIGLMPMPDDSISRGKGGLKLIQYMGLGIVSVSSVNPVSEELIENEKNSFLVKQSQQWEFYLRNILENRFALSEIGLAARNTILSRYTVNSNTEHYMFFVNSI